MNDTSEAGMRMIRDLAIQIGRIYLEAYQLKASSSLIPSKLPPHIHNAVINAGAISPGMDATDAVRSIFGLELSKPEALYFLQYIGVISEIKMSRNSYAEFIDLRARSATQYRESQRSLNELAAQVGVSPDVESLRQAILDYGSTKPLFEFSATLLIVSIEKLEQTIATIDRLEKQLKEEIMVGVGLLAMKDTSTLNAMGLERAAEEYFLNRLSITTSYLN